MTAAEAAKHVGRDVACVYSTPTGDRAVGASGRWRLARVTKTHLVIQRYDEVRVPLDAVKALTPFGVSTGNTKSP